MADTNQPPGQAEGQAQGQPQAQQQPHRRPPPDAARRQERHESRAGSTYVAFIRAIEEKAGVPKDQAEAAAIAALSALESRIVEGEAKDLESQLPYKLREFLSQAPGRELSAHPPRRHKEELILKISRELGCDEAEAERLARCVYQVSRSWISEGEAEQIANQLPPEIRPLWLAEQ